MHWCNFSLFMPVSQVRNDIQALSSALQTAHSMLFCQWSYILNCPFCLTKSAAAETPGEKSVHISSSDDDSSSEDDDISDGDNIDDDSDYDENQQEKARANQHARRLKGLSPCS